MVSIAKASTGRAGSGEDPAHPAPAFFIVPTDGEPGTG